MHSFLPNIRRCRMKIYKRSRLIGGQRGDLIVAYRNVPCIRIEVQLLYKARKPRSKDDLDFETCLPLMSAGSKRWLGAGLEVLYPEGHRWQGLLSE